MKTPVEFLAEFPEPMLVIGGQAVRVLGYARQTSDWDFMIAVENAAAVKRIIEAQGYKEVLRTSAFLKFQADDKARGDLDVMTVDARTFAKMSAGSSEASIDGVTVRVPSIAHLIALKLHAIKNNFFRELQDMTDIVELLNAHPDAMSDDELRSICDRYAPRGLFEKIQYFRHR